VSEDDLVAEVLGDWYARGEVEDPAAVIAAHEAIAEPLRAAFAARALLGCARTDARDSAGTQRTIGEFRIVREIGRGGMGVVYEAEQLPMGRRVALKLLDPAITFSLKGIERFRREARAAGRLHHTNIVPIFAMGEADDVWYYAMEWVRGTTLADVISALRRRGARTVATPGTPSATPDSSGLLGDTDGRAYYARAALACAGVADGLAFAHEAGVVHRDVKPANLVFDAAGTLKLMDFGLARVEAEASPTVTGELLGTPAYMSPEQARGADTPIDGRTDIYSLGATLYELLTLTPPFPVDDPRRTSARVLTEEPVRPRRVRPQIPEDLETIVLKAMEKEPDRRYRTAGAMARDLRSFASGRAIEARPIGRMGRAWRVLHRHRALSVLGVFVALLVGAVAVLAAAVSDEAAFRRRLERTMPAAGTTARVDAGRADDEVRRRLASAARSAVHDPAARIIGEDWAQLDQIPVGSYGLGAAFVGGRLYAISGYFTARVAVYAPERDEWSEVAPLPRPLQYFGTAVIDERIYVVGGDLGGTGATADLLVFDPAVGTWSTRAPMPGGPRWDVGAAVLDGRLWVLGGREGETSRNVDRVEVYDPATDRWTTSSPMPAPRGLAGGVAAMDRRIFVVGGSVGDAAVAKLDVFDPATGTWSSKAPLPEPSASQAVVIDGRLFVVGGGVGPAPAAVYAYDPASNAWAAQPRMLWPRRAHGVAFDPRGRRLYAVAGYLDSWLPSLEVCSPRPPAAPAADATQAPATTGARAGR